MSYDPLTDDILMAVEMAQERARTARQEDGTWRLTHLLSGFDLHPKVMSALLADQVETHAGRISAGADPERALMSIYLSGLLVGLFLGEVREARKIAARGAA
jgi:hypothetical protein